MWLLFLVALVKMVRMHRGWWKFMVVMELVGAVVVVAAGALVMYGSRAGIHPPPLVFHGWTTGPVTFAKATAFLLPALAWQVVLVVLRRRPNVRAAYRRAV